MPLKNCKGVSLIELLLAALLMTFVMVTLSIALPHASKNEIQNRQRTVANNFAQDQLDALKGEVYDQLDTTQTLVPTAFSGPTCDCTTADYSQLVSRSTVVVNTTYTAATCVSWVSPPTWTPLCASAPGGDPGFKNITVRVSWSTGETTSTVIKQSLLSRT